jgi:hypothetical protein
MNAAMKTLFATCAAALALAGCVDISGGGWIPSINVGAKATFGFSSHCTDTQDGAVLTGDIQYVDHGVIVNPKGKKPMAIHMDITQFFGGAVEGTCAENDAIWAGLTGIDGRIVEYCPQPSNGSDCGLALVAVQDTGNNGPTKGDLFFIELIDGAYGGYVNLGELGGGNITVGTP